MHILKYNVLEKSLQKEIEEEKKHSISTKKTPEGRKTTLVGIIIIQKNAWSPE